MQFDPTDRSTIDNPFPVFARLRREMPVHWSDTARGWVLTRYQDCKAVLLDARFSAERMKPFFRSLPAARRERLKNLESSVGLWTVFLDPPDHTRLRALLNRGFTSGAVRNMAPRVAEIVHELLDEVAGKAEIDFIRDLAFRIPASVIMEMLGVPRAEIEHFKIWSDDISLFVGSSRVTPDKYQRAEAAVIEMGDAFRQLINERRHKPRNDMITDLIRAEDNGLVLNQQELVATCIMLLFAGHETTSNLLGNGFYHLLKNPRQLEKLRADPRLGEQTVEEVLRYDGPIGAATRIVTETVEMGGNTLERGQRVFAMINAANRDPEMFPNPEIFDIRRKTTGNTPLGQFGFGHGIHFCIGAPLARLEGRIAFPIFVERMRHPELVETEPPWIDSLSFRGLTRLPLRCVISG